jgi:hypothetical protein
MDYNRSVATQPPVTVVETPEFISRAKRLLAEEERDELIGYLAHNPKAGDVVPGAGGIRKIRWRLEGRGKRGGARVIYFFHDVSVPLFLLTVFPKNERVDLSQADCNGFQRLTKLLVETYRSPKR